MIPQPALDWENWIGKGARSFGPPGLSRRIRFRAPAPRRQIRRRTPVMLAQPLRQHLHVLFSAAADQLRKFVRIEHGNRMGRRRRLQPAAGTPAHQAPDDAHGPHLAAGAETSFGTIGVTGEPGPIFCRLPVITLSVSARPVTLTASPSVGPNCTIFCSALLSAPTT